MQHRRSENDFANIPCTPLSAVRPSCLFGTTPPDVHAKPGKGREGGSSFRGAGSVQKIKRLIQCGGIYHAAPVFLALPFVAR